eukprot:gb/GECG01014686.1/.p1 GENE.gb/GECG01014686.1/~~gb/GECG01014686.1/.p1  ORF type:complete len:538 (+),score=44.21 gb/GECG01014686.1/:1-1614(+)
MTSMDKSRESSGKDNREYLAPNGGGGIKIWHNPPRSFLNFLAAQKLVTEQNQFRHAEREDKPLPSFEENRHELPQPHWKGHEETIRCYWKVWELVFRNLRDPPKDSGFIHNYVDTAFNDCLFMWDSVFILAYTRYARRVFPFQQTLDNLYATQTDDGFITRELRRDGTFQFHPSDIASTGPNVLAWSEWMHWETCGDKERLAKVFPVLLAYHRWMRTNRTWQNGSYYSCGLGCGMDNQPRVPPGYDPMVHHGHMSWIDATAQAALSARILHSMAVILGRSEETTDLVTEHDWLREFIREYGWSDDTGFIHDVLNTGECTSTMSIAAFWCLLAGMLDENQDSEKIRKLCSSLEDSNRFARLHQVPTLAAIHPSYNPDGGYWCGGVWPPTNYLVLRSLETVGKHQLAHAVALNHVESVTEVFSQTQTVWENYAPDKVAPGNPAKADFCGWSGIGPVAVLFEFIFGLRPNSDTAELVRCQFRSTEITTFASRSPYADLGYPTFGGVRCREVSFRGKYPPKLVLQSKSNAERRTCSGYFFE